MANENLDLPVRWWAQVKLSALPRKSSICRVRNRCLITNKGRSVIKRYKLSRMELRRVGSTGYFPGLTKVNT